VTRRLELTCDQIADRTGKGLGYTRGILELLEQEGKVERAGTLGQRWRLTEQAELEHGPALRGMRDDDLEDAA
jgi:hypothetical protein